MSALDLLKINVNDHTEKKNGLTYLSWAWAWQEAIKADPAATWEVKMFGPNFDRPYVDIGETKMVFVEVTMFGKTLTCPLPVLDHRNKAIPNPCAFAVNTAIVRGLTKCVGMHGLGLYIYAGEDLPEGDTHDVTPIIKALEESKDVATLQTNWKTAYQALQSLPDALKLANQAKDKRKLELAA